MRLLVAGIAVLVFGTVVPLAFDSAAAPQAQAATGRINVTATLTYATRRAVPPAGRQSDASEQTWRITDRFGKTIGRMIVWCRWVRPRARFCQNELQMPRGRIVAVGSSLTPFDGEYAVTGGTGSYRTAGGTMLFTAIGIRKTVLLLTITT